jgi:hypothetical protein
MAVFELIQPALKDAADAGKVIDTVRTNLGNFPGVQSFHAMKVLKASGRDADKQGATHFVLGQEA